MIRCLYSGTRPEPRSGIGCFEYRDVMPGDSLGESMMITGCLDYEYDVERKHTMKSM